MEEYEINAETLLIIPFGNGKSKVFELDREFIVNKIPLDIIKNSCIFFGSSYDGRKEAIKNMLSIDMKVPIVIEESRNIIFFPTANCINKNSIWISYQNLIKYSKENDFSTVLYFYNNKKVIVDVKFNLIDNQVIRCIKLESLLTKRRNFIENTYFIDKEKELF